MPTPPTGYELLPPVSFEEKADAQEGVTALTPLQAKYYRCIFTLLESSSSAVRFEAALSLYHLSTAPSAIRALTTTFIRLLCDVSSFSFSLSPLLHGFPFTLYHRIVINVLK